MFGLCLIDVQQRQRMDQVQPVLTGSDKTNLGLFSAPNPLVHLIGMAELLSSVAFIVDKARLLIDAIIDQTDI